MNQKLRHKRLRQLVSRVNQVRKKQAQKIDLICNDLIAAQRSFIKSLNGFSFTANFYESIIGRTELKDLFNVAGGLIKDEIGNANVIFFLRQQDSFEMHTACGMQKYPPENQALESFFAAELVDDICKSNKLCTIADLLEMGLQANPGILNKISAVTIPLIISGTSLGFILIYRSSRQKLCIEDVSDIRTVASGLARAINCSRTICC